MGATEPAAPASALDHSPTQPLPSGARLQQTERITATDPMDHSSGFTLATVLIGGSGLFVLATLFFGTKGGYYDTDQYDGNGTAH